MSDQGSSQRQAAPQSESGEHAAARLVPPRGVAESPEPAPEPLEPSSPSAQEAPSPSVPSGLEAQSPDGPSALEAQSANGAAEQEAQVASAPQEAESEPGAEQPAAGSTELTARQDAPAVTGRYSVISAEDDSYVSCRSAPNLHLHIERGLAVTKGGRKRYPRQTIFLDGAYADAPFLDNQQRQYSLDHHVGCLRPFTLATCEQAVVMLLQGLPLDEGEWHILINEPDVDAVLAAWVLFNHAELIADERKLLHSVMPLIRVEGVIDAHGLEMGVLSGLPAERYQAEQQRIETLREREVRHRSAGNWNEIDYRPYTAALLEQIDRVLVPAEYWRSRVQVEEVLELPLEERKLAVLCRAKSGIYEAEAQLKQRFGKQLAVIVLDQGGQRFTLRQVDPFLPKTLKSAYQALNGSDPRLQSPGSAAEENAWGGSDEIGGSPRHSGSGLDGRRVLELVRDAYAERRRWWRRIFRRKS